MTDKLELKSCHEVIDTVSVADVDSIFYGKPIDPDILTVVMKDGKRLYCDEVCPIDSLQEEHVSEDLKEFELEYFEREKDSIVCVYDRHAGLVDGAKWQKEHSWKPADGNDLPEYEREVIALYQPGPLKLEKTEYCVSFAHRPNPKGWDGKSILTGMVEHYTPKTYGKGGWNIPDVKWWLDLDFPNES